MLSGEALPTWSKYWRNCNDACKAQFCWHDQQPREGKKWGNAAATRSASIESRIRSCDTWTVCGYAWWQVPTCCGRLIGPDRQYSNRHDKWAVDRLGDTACGYCGRYTDGQEKLGMLHLATTRTQIAYDWLKWILAGINNWVTAQLRSTCAFAQARGLKPRSFRALDAGLEGPLFHGAASFRV